MHFNPRNIITLLSNHFRSKGWHSATTEEEVALTNEIIAMMECSAVDMAVVEDLDFAIDLNLSDDSSSEEEVDEEEVVHKGAKAPDKRRKLAVDYSAAKKKEILEHYEHWDFIDIQHHYRRVHTYEDITRMRASLLPGGGARQKWHAIDEQLYAKFFAWKGRFMIARDVHLQAEAIAIARAVGLPAFQASHTWLARWKRKHRVVSRKITEYRGRRVEREQSDIDARTVAFLEDVEPFVAACQPLVNFDQSAISLETVPNRTLSFQGEKKTIALVQREAARKHSLSVLPVISMDGDVLPKLAVVFYEPRVPQKFITEMRPLKNLVCMSSKSGMFTTLLQSQYLEAEVVPAFPAGATMLMDSWTGYNQILEGSIGDFSRKFFALRIPPKCTAHLQPLDRTYNHHFKSLVRNMMGKIERMEIIYRIEEVEGQEIDYIVSTRFNLGRLLSFAHFVMCAPRFKNLVMHGWYSAGILKERPGHFDSPTDYVLHDFDPTASCASKKCGAHPFTRCPYCKAILCFAHSIEKMHQFEKCAN